jgi:hypothetical protein
MADRTMAGLTDVQRASDQKRPLRERAVSRVERPFALAFLFFFALLVLLPLVETLYPIIPEYVPPVDEHRQLNPFPSLRILLNATGDFATALNRWFDDRVGFRDLFIRTKNQIDYSVFGTSRKVYIGHDGWLFEPYSQLDDAELAILEKNFLSLAEWLRERDIRLIVIGYPAKAEMYPEMLPPQVDMPPSDGNFGKFRRFLATQPALIFIDVEKILKQEKPHTQDRFFLKTDPHVTQVTQALIVKEIVERLAKAEGRPEIRWNEKFELKHSAEEGGAEERFLSLLFARPEHDYPYFTGTYTVGGSEPDGTWFVPDPRIFDRDDDGVGRPFDYEFRSLPELCPQRLPGMVLFGNSFSDFYWTLGLHRYFCFIRRVRDPISRLTAFLDTIPAGTKYFIFQYWDPWLGADTPPSR